MSFAPLDRQVATFREQLISRVSLSGDETAHVASTIALEVRGFDRPAQLRVREASPVSLADRLAELQAFQTWMDIASGVRANPAVTRAQVVVQNYICFVYLGEACFRVLKSVSPDGSVTKRCCRFLTDNPVRAFRNAVAHSNWTYRSDHGALVFWARKGSDTTEPLTRFEVDQAKLNFWQALSRCVAYAAYSSIESAWHKDVSNREHE